MTRPFRLALLALVLSAGSACRDTDAPPITQPGPEAPRLHAVTIADPGLIRDGDAVALQADVRDQYNKPFGPVTLRWTVSDPLIATVSSGGLLTALREGTVEVMATAIDGNLVVQQRRQVPIVLHPATAIELSRTAMELPIGATGGAAVTLRGLDGRVLVGRPIEWTSDNPRVAEVNAQGVVTPRSGGTARITARYGSLTAMLTVTVPTPPPTAESFRVVLGNGLPLPLIVAMERTPIPNGFTGTYTRLESGAVSIGATYAVTLQLVTYEFNELGGNTIVRVVGRTTIRDAGTVTYDWFTGEAHFTSTSVGGLSHRLWNLNGVTTLTFREPGTDNTWNLGLERVAR